MNVRRVILGIVVAALCTAQAFARDCDVVDLSVRESGSLLLATGDVIHFTATGDGSVLEINPGDGSPVLRGAPGEVFAVRYESSGTHSVSATMDGAVISSGLDVNVVDMPIPGEMPLMEVADSSGALKVLRAEDSSGGFSVGSVVGDPSKNIFCLRLVGRGTVTPYGSGEMNVLSSGTSPAGDRIQIVQTNGKVTLVKSTGGTHVLDPGTDYKLKIAGILLSAGPSAYAPVGEDIADDEFTIAQDDAVTYQVIPGPGWALYGGSAAGDLFTWSGWGLFGTGTDKSVTYDRYGERTVTVTCPADSSGKSGSVVVLQIRKVTVSDRKLPLGDAVTLVAKQRPNKDYPSGYPTWERRKKNTDGSWGAWSDLTATGRTITDTPTDSGHYMYRATFGSQQKTSQTVTFIKVEKLQYKEPGGSWTDVGSSTLYVLKGTKVQFKAIPHPAGGWPSGKPVWGGTAGASGTGEKKSVKFKTLSSSSSDAKTVTATCGNTETADVVVFELTGTLTPDDNFAGRNQKKYGIEETVDLDFTTTPTGITAAQAGGLEWTKKSGKGAVSSAGNDGTADYDAEHTKGSVKLRITIKSGPSKGKHRTYKRKIIPPSGTRMTRATGNVRHTRGTASAGIALHYWLNPTDVSFSNLEFGEDACPATGATGIYVTSPPGNHGQNTFGAILGGNSVTGCRVNSMDGAWTIRNPWAPGGRFTWRIPTQYIDDTATRNTFGNRQRHRPTIQRNGTTTMTKGGQSGTAAVGDPTSGW